MATVRVFPGTIIEVRPGPLARYGNHQESLSGRLEQKYLPSDSRLEWFGEEPLFKPACFSKFSNCLSRQIKISTLLPRKSKRGVKEKQVERTLLG